MASRGVHFAIGAEQAQRLSSPEDDDQLMALVEEIEEAWEAAFETDKAWDPLHRCLSNGTLYAGEGEPPLNKAFFGGRLLNQEDDYFVVLITPTEVAELAAALPNVTESWLRSRYFGAPFPAYEIEKCEEDFGYMWSSFQGLPDFFARAAAAGQHVIFTVSD